MRLERNTDTRDAVRLGGICGQATSQQSVEIVIAGPSPERGDFVAERRVVAGWRLSTIADT